MIKNRLLDSSKSLHLESQDRIFSKYLVIYGGLLIILLLHIIGINAAIDPDFETGFPQISFFNKYKTETRKNGGRVWVANAIKHLKPEYVILGTSKSQRGMLQTDQSYRGYRFLNASIPGTNFYELSTIIDYLLNIDGDIKVVILTLDFLTFSSRRTIQGDFRNSKFCSDYSCWKSVSQLISYRCLHDSFNTYQKNRTGYLPHIPLGTREIFSKYFKNNFFINAEAYAHYQFSPERMHLFRNGLRKLLNAGVDVKLRISPSHCSQYAGYKKLKIWNQFKNWKQNIVTTVEELKTEYPWLRIHDFALHNSRTMEKIPEINSEAKMRWFKDSNHYTQEFGKDMLNILHGENDSQELFVLLTQENIQLILNEMELEQNKYTSKNQNEIAWVSQKYQETEVLRKKNLDYYQWTQKIGQPYKIVSN